MPPGGATCRRRASNPASYAVCPRARPEERRRRWRSMPSAAGSRALPAPHAGFAASAGDRVDDGRRPVAAVLPQLSHRSTRRPRPSPATIAHGDPLRKLTVPGSRGADAGQTKRRKTRLGQHGGAEGGSVTPAIGRVVPRPDGGAGGAAAGAQRRSPATRISMVLTAAVSPTAIAARRASINPASASASSPGSVAFMIFGWEVPSALLLAISSSS